MARRNNSRGYTLVEMLVGMVILLLVIAGALSFFIFQSTEGFESFRLKRVDEAVSLAQSVIARDILEAGFGLSDNPELALYILDGDSTSPATPGLDTFYVNYNGYLTMEITSSTATGAAADAVKANAIYFDGVTGYQGFFKFSSTDQFTLRYCPRWNGVYDSDAGVVRPNNVGGVIVVDSTGTTKAGQVLLNDSVTKCEDETSPTDVSGNPLYQKCTFKVSPTMAVNDTAAPAICYRVIVGADNIGALWRNPGAKKSGSVDAPVGMPFLGGEPYFTVTGFAVDYQLENADGTVTWQKSSLSKATVANLKLVRVRLTYRTRGQRKEWSPPYIRTITGSPRNLVMGGS